MHTFAQESDAFRVIATAAEKGTLEYMSLILNMKELIDIEVVSRGGVRQLDRKNRMARACPARSGILLRRR